MKKKRNILLLIESSTAYGRKITKGISLYVREHDHWTLHVEDRGLFSVPTQLLQGWNGDGIISRTSDESIRKTLEHCRCPIVELLGIGDDPRIDVLPDDHKTMELCIEHFLEKNITSIGFYAYGDNWWINRRRDAFIELAQRKKIRHSCWVDISSSQKSMHPEWEDQFEKPLGKWLLGLPEQTGVIAAYDPQAMRVLNVCRQLGIEVPDQLAILGIDNDEHLCNLVTPPLSSLDRNAESVGYKAAELLDAKINRKKILPSPVVIPPKGVVARRSTDITAVSDPDVFAALKYIADFATRGISIDEVALHVGLSRSTLGRLFQKTIKRSPKAEIMRIRLNHAKFLLSHTDLPVRSIALRTGYKTVEYFITMFKRHAGMTPNKYRNKYHYFDDYPDLVSQQE